MIAAHLQRILRYLLPAPKRQFRLAGHLLPASPDIPWIQPVEEADGQRSHQHSRNQNMLVLGASEQYHSPTIANSTARDMRPARDPDRNTDTKAMKTAKNRNGLAGCFHRKLQARVSVIGINISIKPA